MRFAEPIADPAAPLARRNPTAKVAAALVVTVALVVSLDPVAPAVALAVELAVLPLFGLRYRALAARFWPLLVAAGGAALTYLVFGQRTGEVLVSAGPWVLTTGMLVSGASLVLRVFALALPGIAVFASTDPTDLADSLVQNAKMPARFALGALAALRLLPLLGNDWEMLRMARRARGVDAGGNPLARLRMFASMTFAMLVHAIRRGTQLATAMDARGFDSGLPRSYAREQPFRAADAALVAGAVALSIVAVAASVATGVFNPVFR
ncbi:energy-coupling factor transporter transmembrane component T [Luedemannella helvata]|uniref:Energy-coupling factor transporter transmembrane component T n=1 Tax=Luedemannella helvata TaxID=349315 RepID=A0ABP4WPX7_9ACTN